MQRYLSEILSFQAVARYGSISAATRAGAGPHATLSRHISTLEEGLGIILFERRKSGLHLSEIGETLLEQATQLIAASDQFILTAAGGSQVVSGTVQITASRVVSGLLLPPILARMTDVLPQIKVDLIASDDTMNLLTREADIAVRMHRPNQSRLVARKLGDVEFGIYASRDYISRRGMPTSLDQIADHVLIGGPDQSDFFRDIQKKFGGVLSPDVFQLRCTDSLINWLMLQQGCGITMTQIRRADADRNLVRVMPDLPVFQFPIWLTSHSELKSNARIRRVFDYLAEEISAML